MMTIKRTDSFVEGGRYQFDFELCHNWTQIDTRQDAPYYGNWICPVTRKLRSFCEGHLTLNECDTDEEFIQCLKDTLKWHLKNGYLPKLDVEGEHIMYLVEMGFECFFHTSYNINKAIEFVGADEAKFDTNT